MGGVARNWKVLNLSTLEILARVRAEGGCLGGSQESEVIEPQHPRNSGEGGRVWGGSQELEGNQQF